MPQTIVNIRMDEALKRNFDFICDELGMNMSTAITIFAKQVCREKRIPFEIALKPTAQEKETKIMTKTKFTVFIGPDCSPNEITAVEGSFDDFDDAYLFLREEYDKMQEKMWDSHDEYLRKADIYLGIEFINPENMYRHAIYDDLGCELVYEYNNKKESLNKLCSEEVCGDMFAALYGFVMALNITGRIVL